MQLYYVDPVFHAAVMVMMVMLVVVLVVVLVMVVVMDHRSPPSSSPSLMLMMVVIYDSMLPTFCTIAQFQAPRLLSVSSFGHQAFNPATVLQQRELSQLFILSLFLHLSVKSPSCW